MLLKKCDTETNFDYFGARYYDSDIYRWLSIDPLADMYPGWSPYNYCANDPVNMLDPDGRFFIIDDFIAGLFGGLIDGKGFNESVDQGAEYADNSMQIWSSFGRGDFTQIVSKFTWELPQQLAGVFGGHVTNMIGQVNSITHSEGATLIETKADYWGGFTIGSVITADKETKIGSDLYYHEYGHYIQSQLIGPYYIPFAGLPSLFSSMIDPWNHNRKFYTETWANRLAKKKFGHEPWKK